MKSKSVVIVLLLSQLSSIQGFASMEGGLERLNIDLTELPIQGLRDNCVKDKSFLENVKSITSCFAVGLFSSPTIATHYASKASRSSSQASSEDNSKEIMQRARSGASRILAADPSENILPIIAEDENLQLAYYYLGVPNEDGIKFDGNFREGALKIIKLGQ